MLDASQVASISAMLRQRDVKTALSPALQVHRNTVWLSWLAAMRAQFPSVCALDEFAFDRAARDFLCVHPPRHAVLLDMGEGFAPWLDALEAPIAADLARLDWAWSRAHAAADAQALSAAELVTCWSHAQRRLRLHPSIQLLEVKRPEALARWLAQRFGLDPHPAQPTRVVIHRVDDHVQASCPEAAHWAFLKAAGDRASVEQAIGLAAAAQAEVDWAPWGQCILERQWLSHPLNPFSSSEESHHVD